jgi:hypothetical protein
VIPGSHCQGLARARRGGYCAKTGFHQIIRILNFAFSHSIPALHDHLPGPGYRTGAGSIIGAEPLLGSVHYI